MADIRNDRDEILQAASPRLNVVSTDFISFTSSATGFTVNGSTATPSVIVLSFQMNGRLSGTPTINTTGLSSVSTVVISSTLTQVSVPYSSMLSDTCSVTATINFAGSVYTSTATISGKVTAPGQVGNSVTIVPESLLLRITWPKNTEIDVLGYEVRTTDSNWGTDTNYLFRGNATSCAVSMAAPTTAGSIKTYFIRAYNTSNLFSASSRSASYTIAAPIAPTGLNATYSSSSATTSTATLTWNTNVPVFGLKQYRVRVTLPNATYKEWTVNTPNLVVDTTWTGDASAVVYTTDLLGNESSGSAAYTVSKYAPNLVTLPATPATPVGTKLLLDWNEVTRTSLPIVAYEVRSSNTNWGDNSTYLWKGSVSECQVNPGAINVSTNYYIRAVDADNIYSPTSAVISYTRTAPPAVTAATYEYSTLTTDQATVVISWNRPAGETFAIDFYRVTLTKPGPKVITADIYANSWSLDADWEGSATFTIQVVDIFGAVSSTYTRTIYKVPPSITNYVIATPTPVSNTLLLSWTPSLVKTNIAWTRSGTVATITDTAHGYTTNDAISITSSSDVSTIPVGVYVITVVNANSYTITCLNAGAASGTVTISNGSLRTTQYEIRASNNTTVLYKGSNPSFSLQATNISVGSNTYYLYAIDSAGKYSTNSRVITYTYNVLSNITGTASFTSSGTALFKWNPPSVGSFDLQEYSLSLNGPGGSAILYTTDWEIPVAWSNSTVTLTITPKDVLGTAGAPSTITLTNEFLSTPGAPIPTLRGTDLELDWPDNTINPSRHLPVGRYELRDASNNLVWKGSQSKASISLVGLTPAQNTWYLYVYDTNGYPCATPRQYVYSNLVNPAQIPVNTINYSFGTNISDSLLTISWAAQTPTFGLKHYKVSYSDNGTTVTTTVLSNSVNISPIPRNPGNTTWTGDKQFSISVVDQLGNESIVSSIAVTKNAPGIVTDYTAQVIDNNVLLQWVLPTRTTLPIDTVRIKKGSDWASATVIGDKTGTFTTILERAGGKYTYWIAAVDNDGVECPTPTQITATVAQPPDYVFSGQQFSTFTGTKVNALVDGTTLILPVDLTSTWAQHFTNNSWATPDAQIAAGYPVYIQPTLSSGSYEETFDFGTTLSSTKVTVNLLGTIVAGTESTVNRVVTIDTSPDGINWLPTPYVGISMFAVNFRYVKVKITVTQTDGGKGTYRINSLDVSLDAKQKSDSGMVTMAIGGAHPQGNIAHDYVSLWVPGSLPTTYFALNGTASENSITNSAGPGGYVQPIWNCIDNDAASDPDGGWLSTYFSADMSKGHLFAVFIKTTSNNGTTYWGTSQNSTILDLAGTANTNPYFWYGDLPTLDTWYLVVGYVHEIGYGTTDTGISGVYNLSGTKVVSGTEFKAAAGTTSLMHRCYHYYNVANTASIVQSMARPVVIPCTVANAPSLISYLVQCGNSYGATATPTTNFVDIISITATAQTSPTTPIVDFTDIPYPKRFNIFNYNSSGSLVGGTVSWAVRGY